MKPIKKLSSLGYIAIREQAIELLEQLQNHHIATVMDGTSNLGELAQEQASELVYRSMRVGLENGINVPNIRYQVTKLESAIEILE